MTKTPEPYCQKMKRSNRRCAYWTIAWVLSQAAATFGGKLWWPESTVLKSLFIVVNVAIGLGMVLNLRRFLSELDELDRRIQMDALGLTVGLGLVFGLPYATIHQIDLISGNAEIPYLVIFMSLTYAVGIILGNKRYK